MRNLNRKKWSPWAVTLVNAIANLGAIPPVAAQTNPHSAAQSAELTAAKRLNQQLLQLDKQGK